MTTLERIRRSQELQDLFFDLVDFELEDEEVPEWLGVDAGHRVQVFGRDGAGGIFFVLTPPAGALHVVYCSSEGQAGTLASSLDGFFAVTAAVPHWRDCLKFSNSGSLAEMRRCEPLLAKECHDDIDGYDKKRKAILKRVGLPLLPDPVRALHEAVGRTPAGVFFDPFDRAPFASLFNTFKWRG